MNVQQCVRVHVQVPGRNHICHLNGLVCGSSLLSAQCSIFLAQMHRTFAFSYIQILAKVAILVDGVVMNADCACKLLKINRQEISSCTIANRK